MQNVKQGKIPKFKERFQKIVDSFGGQTEFACVSGISRQTIGFWYNGDRVPNAEMLIEISRCCHVSVDYLLGLTECASNNTDLRAVCDCTGLSEKAVRQLRRLNGDARRLIAKIINDVSEYEEVLL